MYNAKNNSTENDEELYTKFCNMLLNHLDNTSVVNLLQKEIKIIDLGIDSLAFTDIILSIEEKWNITFETEYYAYSAFDTLEDLYNYCRKIRQNEQR